MALGFAYGAGAGGSPPAASMQADSSDDRMVINCGTGTSPTTGTYGTVTFAGNYSSAVDTTAPPVIQIIGIGPFASLIQWAVTGFTPQGFTFAGVTAPAASKAAGPGGFGQISIAVLR